MNVLRVLSMISNLNTDHIHQVVHLLDIPKTIHYYDRLYLLSH